jgi:uncharacterized membrane protein YedE/YeeE
MSNFTPISALIGGALIGLSALILVLLDGRIAGIAGIVGRLGYLRTGDIAWRVAFILGLIAAPALYALAGGRLPDVTPLASPGVILAGGLLVGFGTRLGNGCTSGHGVCGIARFSPRSLVATAIFMAVGIATVFVTRHVLGG